MSFDANIGRAQPMIKPPTNMNNDGGSGGNTGYMQGRRQKKEKEHKSLFESKDEFDYVDLKSKLPQDIENKIGYKNSWFENMVEKFIK